MLNIRLKLGNSFKTMYIYIVSLKIKLLESILKLLIILNISNLSLIEVEIANLDNNVVAFNINKVYTKIVIYYRTKILILIMLS